MEEPLRTDLDDDDVEAHEKNHIHSYEFVTIGEAEKICRSIERQYQENTKEIQMQRLEENLTTGLKRKYTMIFRQGMKIAVE